MNEPPHHGNGSEVHHDGLAMLGILVLTIALIAFVGYNVI